VLIPIEAYLLRGALGSTREIAGVLVTVTQWFFLNRALNARSVAAFESAVEAAEPVGAPSSSP
jgi:hypothetical protein